MNLVGQRSTRQRTLVAEALDNCEDFRSAQDLHELIGESGETVGLATVYRTLQALAEANLVDVISRADGEVLYRKCSESHHHHLVCRTCGLTVEVSGPAVEKWSAKIAEENSFTDISHTLELFGLCSACS